MVTQSINLNLVPSGIEPRINVSQYDTGLSSLVCYMYEDTDVYNIPDGYTVMISGRTSVGTAFTITAAEVSGNKVVFPIKAVMTSDAGIDECEVSIINGKSGDDSEILGSANFQIVVEQAPLTKETVTRSDWDSIQQLANDVIDAQSSIDADKAESAAAMAAAKAWAVGPSDELTAGTDTDNAKYYAAQAKASADKAESISAVSIATTSTAGIVKPDGDSITVDADGTIHGASKVPVATAEVVEHEERLDLLEYMETHNDHFAPLIDDDDNMILDDDGNAVMVDWKYKYA